MCSGCGERKNIPILRRGQGREDRERGWEDRNNAAWGERQSGSNPTLLGKESQGARSCRSLRLLGSGGSLPVSSVVCCSAVHQGFLLPKSLLNHGERTSLQGRGCCVCLRAATPPFDRVGADDEPMRGREALASVRLFPLCVVAICIAREPSRLSLEQTHLSFWEKTRRKYGVCTPDVWMHAWSRLTTARGVVSLSLYLFCACSPPVLGLDGKRPLAWLLGELNLGAIHEPCVCFQNNPQVLLIKPAVPRAG